MTIEKLPSGKYRVKLYLGTDPSGKKRFKSFTASTRKEALMRAAQYDDEAQQNDTGGTVSEVVARYIQLKAPVLSPSTVRDYKGYAARYIDPDRFGRLDFFSCTPVQVQEWISHLALTLSPKSCSNIYGLFSATVSVFRPQLVLKVRLPQKIKPRLYTPSNTDVKRVLDYLRESGDRDTYIAVLLSSCGSLRRGEICALTADSVDRVRRTVSITGDLVKDEHHQFVLKDAPKTGASYREVQLPQAVIDLLPTEGRLVRISPDQLSNRFARAVRALGLPHFRFHDLRSYWLTILTYAGVPARILQAMGGWETDHVMKSVYLRVIDEEKQKQLERISAQFENSILLDSAKCP